mgnify:CR=1 FL=1
MKGKQLPQPKTVYILKKSSPKKPPKNVYILTKSSNNSPISSDEVPTKQMNRPPNQNVSMLDTLSIYKKSQLPSMNASGSHNFLAVDEHLEGVFTPHEELSDGDITVDSGTGNSLDSQSEEERDKNKAIRTKHNSSYKHRPRIPVRDQLAQKKVQPPANKPVTLGRRPPVKTKIPTLGTSRPSPPKIVPVKRSDDAVRQWETRLNIGQPALPFPSDARATLSIQKPTHHKGVKDISKPVNDVRRVPKRPVRVNYPPPPHGTSVVPNYKKPSRQPVRQQPTRQQHVRILESPSDDDSNEVFKQTSVKKSPRPPPPQLQKKANVPPKNRRGNNALVRLGKVY